MGCGRPQEVTYYDFRFNGAEPEGLTDLWAITCRPRKQTKKKKKKIDCLDAGHWQEMRLTDESFDIGAAPVAGGHFLGDYNGLAAARNQFVAVFSISSATDPADVVFVRFKKMGHGKRRSGQRHKRD